jgi:succinyl-CoA synthetase beta subunit
MLLLASTLLAHRMEGRRMIGEAESKAILRQKGISVPQGVRIAEQSAVPDALQTLRYPVCAKLSSPDGIHKSDLGGVRLALETKEATAAAVAELFELADRKGIAIDGCLVEEMVSGGAEVAIGALSDPRFGPVLMVGMGGVLVELFGDVAFRVCPISEFDAAEMIDDLRAAAVLRGMRGRPALDRAALIEVLMLVGGPEGLMTCNPDHIASLDINPVIVGTEKVVAVDARIELKPLELTASRGSGA